MNAPASATPTPTLSLEHINKTFGGLIAIDEFSLDVYPGEVVALVGDNGAGKSTLIKIIAGVHRPTRGRVLIDGAATVFNDPSDAQKMGIQVVYQDLALADSQPVYMNMFLGRELTSSPLRRLDRGRMIAVTESVLKELDVRIPSVRAIIRELSGGQRQGVAIARATHWAARLILMDEPTAALGVAETARVEFDHPGAQGARPAHSHDQSQPRSGLPPVGSHLRVATRQADRRPPYERRRQERDRLHDHRPQPRRSRRVIRLAPGRRPQLRRRGRARHDVAPLGMLPVLGEHVWIERSDLEPVGAGVPNHVLDQGHRRVRAAHGRRRFEVMGADQRWAANREVEFGFAVDAVDPADVAAARPRYALFDADRVVLAAVPINQLSRTAHGGGSGVNSSRSSGGRSKRPRPQSALHHCSLAASILSRLDPTKFHQM